MDVTRRRLLALGAAGASTGLAGCGGDGPDGGETATDTAGNDPDPGDGETPTEADGDFPDAVSLETIVDGLRAPLDLAFAPDADRRYVAEQQGIVHRHGPGRLADEPFLDLRETVTAGGEKGLLGIALHPEFASNRRVFVRYSAPRRDGTPESYSHTFVLAEFTASDDGTLVDPATERTILEIPQPQGNHNAGDVAFGPDGLMYVAVGDGGAGGDQGAGHVADWYDAVGGGNGQDVTENLLGSILRIDVNDADQGTAYALPDDNPLVDRDGLDEHYAWGLRNPYRMSFDGDGLYVADVGQNRFEEVNLVAKGGNYGWNVKEGTHCFRADDCPDATPDTVRGGEPLVDPVIEYPHSGDPVSGISVIGGHVYRGSAIPSLSGRYVFGDLQAEGRLFVGTPTDGDGLWPTTVLPVDEADAGALGRILSFGQDPQGEVYVLGIGENDGGVHRVVPAG